MQQCQLKIYIQFYQHPSYPQSQIVLEICCNEIGLDTDKGNAYAASNYGCCLIRKCACNLTETAHPAPGCSSIKFPKHAILNLLHQQGDMIQGAHLRKT